MEFIDGEKKRTIPLGTVDVKIQIQKYIILLFFSGSKTYVVNKIM
jgi:hypothetical protein